MIPILYESINSDFSVLGLGVLVDTISCTVTEERNGLFELELEYPIDSELYSELKNERVIVAHSSKKQANQRFVIYRISKPAKRKVKVYAEHITQYVTKNSTLNPFVEFSGNAYQALNTWKNNITSEYNLTTTSDIGLEQSGSWRIDKVQNARQALGGVQGSILDLYGGEYLFDNEHVSLLRKRGLDKNVVIAYGKNLIDITQEEEINNTITSIQPFAVIFKNEGTEDEILTLHENVLHSEYVHSYSIPKVKTVNFSGEEIQTEEELRKRATRYIQENQIGVPKTNLKINFIDLTDTIEYADKAKLEEINLCDTVTIHYEKLGIDNVKAKVVKTKYNPLLERYIEIEIGNIRNNYNQSLISIEEKITKTEQSALSQFAYFKNEIMQARINGEAYNYDLKAGNEYGLPAGLYSFDAPIEQNPTTVIYVGGGVMAIANSKTTDGNWDWRTMATGDGLAANTVGAEQIIAGSITADLITMEKKSLTEYLGNAEEAINTKIDDLELSVDTWTQGEDGYWYLNGNKTSQKWKGEQGIQGLPGENGQSQYVHIRYSANSNGSNFVSTPTTSTKYIGIANTTSSTAPTSAGSYTWSKYAGEDGADGQQGLPGESGKDGQTTYTWVKYADTPTSGMSDYPDGKKYIGLAFNKTTATESTSYSDYQWSLMPQNIEVGGRNLIPSSTLPKGSTGEGVSFATWAGSFISHNDLVSMMEPNEVYTIRYKFRLDSLSPNTTAHKQNVHGTLLLYSGVSGFPLVYLRGEVDTVAEANNWKVGDVVTREATFTSPPNLHDPTSNYGIIAYTRRSMDGDTFVKVEYGTFFDIKLEKGNVATDWTPAPEDMAAELKRTEDEINIQISDLIEKGDEQAGSINYLLGQDGVISPLEHVQIQNLIERISREHDILNAQLEDGEIKGTLNTKFDTLSTLLSEIPTDEATYSIVDTVALKTAYVEYEEAKSAADEVILQQTAEHFSTIEAGQIELGTRIGSYEEQLKLESGLIAMYIDKGYGLEQAMTLAQEELAFYLDGTKAAWIGLNGLNANNGSFESADIANHKLDKMGTDYTVISWTGGN